MIDRQDLTSVTGLSKRPFEDGRQRLLTWASFRVSGRKTPRRVPVKFWVKKRLVIMPCEKLQAQELSSYSTAKMTYERKITEKQVFLTIQCSAKRSKQSSIFSSFSINCILCSSQDKFQLHEHYEIMNNKFYNLYNNILLYIL